MVINAYEGIDVVNFDVPGDHSHEEIMRDIGVPLKLQERFVNIICEINTEYKANAIYENVLKISYLLVLQAIYGCIKSELLWYKIYTKNLHKNGYKFNQYDRCMANNTIEGKGCTVP